MVHKVLLVEDSTSLAVLYKQYVKNENYDLFHVETGSAAKAFILKNVPDLILLDLKLPDIDDFELLDWIVEQGISTSVLVVSAHGSVDVAIKSIQKGALDFLEKPLTAERLRSSVRKYLNRRELASEPEEDDSHHITSSHNFIGSCNLMKDVYRSIELAAPTSASVLINGQSGTGKELCANAIHLKSDRAHKPFVAISCGAIPKDLIESEIFGYTKGAFTGAVADRKGAAMQANGGTLFLDELCEMDVDMQKKLLRFLQTSTFTPLGSNQEVKVDVRVVCATNRDPLLEVEAGRFREDLYYRVHVIPIEMPPLCKRGSDITTLANYFLKLYAKMDGKKFRAIDKDAQRALKSYHWPGNVRQLQNVIRNIVVMNDGASVSIGMMPSALSSVCQPAAAPPTNTYKNLEASKEKVQGVKVESPSDSPSGEFPFECSCENATVIPPQTLSLINSEGLIRPMWKVEKDVIQNAINSCDGNVLNASVMLEISPSTLYRKKIAWEEQLNGADQSRS